MTRLKASEWRPQHFRWKVAERVATITLNRRERKNPLTFESYAELRDTFPRLQYAEDVRVVTDFKRAYEALVRKEKPRFQGD